MGRCGHSKEGPKIEPLFAMTNSQFLSKNYVTIIHPYCTIVNTDKTQTNMGNLGYYLTVSFTISDYF